MSGDRNAPGAAPFIQGYWRSVLGFERRPPNWHPHHRERWWQEEWYRGYDDHQRRISVDDEAA